MGISNSLSDRIRLRRKALRLTQSELAERSGLSFAVIQTLESGKTDPRRKTLEAVAAGLDISIAELLGPEPAPTDKAPTSLSSSAVTGPITIKDGALILSQLADISPERRALVLAILFDDSSVIPESMSDIGGDLSQLLSAIG